jgi:L-threonylcarbamoyladenylate synthase
MTAPPAIPVPALEAAVAALRAGELVAFPTETVYGLGADARNPAALREVFARKGRPTDHPLILHLASAEELPQWVKQVPAAAQRLAAAFWPGPLTMVLECAEGVPAELTGGQPSIAVRVPSHPTAQALLHAFGSGIAAPSANRYGRLSPTRAEHVREEFPQSLLILEGGECTVGLESTIISLLEAPARILRPGVIGAAQIEAVIGPLAVTVARALPRVPGTTAQHYAPRTPLAVVPADLLDARLEEANRCGKAVVVYARSPRKLGIVPVCGAAPVFVLEWRAAPADPEAYARALYADLHELDRRGAAAILVEAVPETEPWLAVRDRLSRAATSPQFS